METGTDIRIARESDRASIIRLMKDAAESGHFAREYADNDRSSALLTAIFAGGSIKFSAVDTGKKFGLIVVTVGQVVRGFSMVTFDGHKAEILLLAVSPAYRRDGLGMVLVREVLASGWPAGTRIFGRCYSVSTAAMALLPQLGFVVKDVSSSGETTFERGVA